MGLKKKKEAQIFFRLKPVELLLSLREGPKYGATLSKETDCTYSHTINLLSIFHKLGLSNYEKRGRIKMVSLTPTGQAIADNIYSILMKLSKISGGK